jgi:acyl-CoA hydrolase
VVTASIHKVDFKERIPIGSLVTCRATVDYVGASSMDITVEVFAEWPSTGERKHANTAHVVFVSIDVEGRPRRVPRLIPGTDEERERYAAAEQYRREHAKK